MSNFRIAPVGTCRIHTPVSRAVDRYPIAMDLRRNYGFVHTSDEALQQIRFFQGEKTFRPEVLPLVFRSADIALANESWEPADLHIVEISSAKRVTSGPDTVQINFVYRHFADFFANTERARRYWNRLRLGHRQDLLDFLERQRSFQLLSDADRDLLLSLSVEQQTFKGVKKDMAEILERLGRDRVLFVTHINAMTPDGEHLPTRDRLIRWVKVAAEQLGAKVFDPTDLMDEIGQNAALESGGNDLTHFTSSFSDRVYRAIHQAHVAPLLGAQADLSVGDERSRAIADIAARVESTLELGDFFEGSRELHSAIATYPGAAQLLRLRGIVRARIGDYPGAMEDLSQPTPGRTPSDAMRLALLEAATGVGDHDRALALAQDLIADEVENASLYRAAAEAAERSGKTDLAIGFAKQVYRRDRSDLVAALHALELISAGGSELQIEEWRSEILDNIAASATGALGLCLWALREGDEDLLAAGLRTVAAADKSAAIELMEDAFNADMQHVMAASVPIAASLGRLGPELADRRGALLQRAIEAARTAFEHGDYGRAHALAKPVLQLAGVQSRQMPISQLAGEARQLIRNMIASSREAIRAAFASGDAAAVIEASKDAGPILEEDARSATLLARSLHMAGETDEALALLRRLQPHGRDAFMVRRWTARLAVAARDYATALEMYGELRESGDPELEKIRPEVDQFFKRAEPRVLKDLSLSAKAGDYERGLRLAVAIDRYIGPRERTERDVARMLSGLRVRLKRVEEGDGEQHDRETILRQMLALRPTDVLTLRRLALHLMKEFRFAEAIEFWDALLEVDPGNDLAGRNRVRCATLAQRRAAGSGLGIESAA